jgi:WD40 repeat protein
MDVRIWNVATRRQINSPIPSSHGVCGVALSPKGGLVAALDDFGRVRLWDATYASSPAP